MTRTEAIATITANLARLDDERILTVAGILEQMAEGDQPIRDLTPRELASIEQSKADFTAGRTSTLAESEAYVTTELARRRAARTRS